MFKLTKATILWAEGLIINDPAGKEFTSFRELNQFLIQRASHCTISGYDKHSIQLEWEDGEVYKTRYDLHHINKSQENRGGNVSVAQSVLDDLEFMSGKWMPSHLTEEQYKEILSNYSDEDKKAAEEFIKTHELV